MEKIKSDEEQHVIQNINLSIHMINRRLQVIESWIKNSEKLIIEDMNQKLNNVIENKIFSLNEVLPKGKFKKLKKELHETYKKNLYEIKEKIKIIQESFKIQIENKLKQKDSKIGEDVRNFIRQISNEEMEKKKIFIDKIDKLNDVIEKYFNIISEEREDDLFEKVNIIIKQKIANVFNDQQMKEYLKNNVHEWIKQVIESYLIALDNDNIYESSKEHKIKSIEGNWYENLVKYSHKIRQKKEIK